MKRYSQQQQNQIYILTIFFRRFFLMATIIFNFIFCRTSQYCLQMLIYTYLNKLLYYMFSGLYCVQLTHSDLEIKLRSKA